MWTALLLPLRAYGRARKDHVSDSLGGCILFWERENTKANTTRCINNIHNPIIAGKNYTGS